MYFKLIIHTNNDETLGRNDGGEESDTSGSHTLFLAVSSTGHSTLDPFLIVCLI